MSEKQYPSFIELPDFFFKDAPRQKESVCPFSQKPCLQGKCACWINLAMDAPEHDNLVTVGGRCGLVHTDYAAKLQPEG